MARTPYQTRPDSNPARLIGGVCAVRDGLPPVPYSMRLSRYSLLAQFILTQTVSEQLPRHRRLAGASRLSLGALSSLAYPAISWSQMGVLLPFIPVLVDRSSVSHSPLSSFSSPLSRFSESACRTSSDRIGGGEKLGFRDDFSKESNCLPGVVLGVVCIRANGVPRAPRNSVLASYLNRNMREVLYIPR